ncbi:MAG: non-canonical purine NTP pyrophosphatase [Gemmatimonadaceae bacterium]|nr:non-canonical purine NTP pyrophosphatase [Gemmatimonadaceae bacterium]
MTRPWVLATRSVGKLRELVPWFAGRGLRVIGLDDAGVARSTEEDGIEVHATFEGNALAKARWYAERTGLPCVADDSGLEVDALAGAPGVRSRRFAADRGVTHPGGEDAANNTALLAALAATGLAPPWPARYVCVAAFADGDERRHARGETGGVIVPTAAGIHGFGYDPYFVSTALGRTFAEATVAEKAAVSHRGRAFAALLATWSGGRPHVDTDAGPG